MRSVRRSARREARALEREALRRLPRRERLSVWWRTRPLGVTFAVYLAAYLAVATGISLLAISVFSVLNEELYEFEVVSNDGLAYRTTVDSGPYIYDPESEQLLPAAELDLPDEGPLAVFIATGNRSADGEILFDEKDRAVTTTYATMDLVRAGKIRLYDWGLNYNEWYPQDEVLGEGGEVTAEGIAEYDALSRRKRAQSVGLFGEMTGADLEATFGSNLVSNTAYYATAAQGEGFSQLLYAVATGLSPVLAYGGLGLLTFRRFYRVHIAGPLGELAGAADRIAGQDLDFPIDTVRGRELGRLSETLEHMRASLLEAQRELWRTAESRRRLNAAFAHDLRTPITVLKGTVEMAQLRVRRGDALEPPALDALSAQVARLERYATCMGGLTKLEDRPVEREDVKVAELLCRLGEHACEVVRARAPELSIEVDLGEGGGDSVLIDVPLVEEVLDNLLSNACGHAAHLVKVRVGLHDGDLRLEVIDDGPGFTPEALHRGCDPFFSENKSAEHFGLGLNVSGILCELHGGGLELMNDSELGARVIATFGMRAD